MKSQHKQLTEELISINNSGLWQEVTEQDAEKLVGGGIAVPGLRGFQQSNNRYSTNYQSMEGFGRYQGYQASKMGSYGSTGDFRKSM
ncbi:hypothetical protein [Lyngbya aestuarii]|uniref:hypothetical protein n=1 Tax=Lyngbya aestuarii TaxID=118322 RepID=UPI00403DC70E